MQRGRKIVCIVAICLWVSMNLFFVFCSGYKPHADQKYIYQAAIQMTEGNFESFTEKGYMGQNPQQGGMLLLEYVVALISKQHVIILMQTSKK